MSKKNRLMTPDERAIHDKAVKLRKLSDEELCEVVGESRKVNGPSPSQIIREFIDRCASSGRRLGPAAICSLKMVAKEAGYDIGV